MDAKVKDFPDLIKRNGGVVNTNHDHYLRAKMRIRQADRLERLEENVAGMQKTLDAILTLMLAAK